MTVYNLSYNKENYQWSEKEVTNKLEKIGILKNKKVAWIRLDLSTCNSNWLSRLIWTIAAKYFSWMRKNFYGVDLEQSRSLLKQIRHQIEGNNKLIELYQSAISRFNTITPHHCINKIEKEIHLPEKKKEIEKKEKPVESSTSESQTDKPSQPSTKTSAPDLIKSIVENHGCSAEEVVGALKKIYEGSGTKLNEMQIKATRVLAQQHIERLKKEREKKSEPITLFQGSVTQFDKRFNDEGKSACTCINLKASEVFVKAKSFEEITTESLDKIIRDGIELWKGTAGKSKTDHLELTQVDFGRLTLKIPEDHGFFGGYTKRLSRFSNHKDYKKVLQESIENHYKQYPYAVIFTKSPETASVIVRSANEFWLYDSHGDPARERKAYIEKYNSLSAVSDALHERFPYVDPTNLGYRAGSLQDYQYNGFSAYILIRILY